MKRSMVIAIAALVLLAGCGRKRARTAAAPPAPRIGAVEEGVASWYGHPYHGRRASNGEIYDMEKLTAAHLTLPFGTMVRVRNLTNDRTVEVRITDRGPFVKNRIIDLSRAAAREIQMIGPGTARVELTILSVPSQAPGYYAVQTGLYRERENAERQRERMEQRFGQARVEARGGDPPTWRVLVGREDSESAAQELAGKIAEEAGGAFVVRVELREND